MTLRSTTKSANRRAKEQLTNVISKTLLNKDIRFDIRRDELELLFDYYGKDMKKGTVNYRQFDDDIYYINKKEKARRSQKEDNRNSKSEGRRDSKEEEGVKEIDYSLRPTHNLPDDNRYSMKNTVVGKFPDSRTQKKHVIKISDAILQDIIKATYTRDILVGDAFKKFGKGRNAVISEGNFKEA